MIYLYQIFRLLHNINSSKTNFFFKLRYDSWPLFLINMFSITHDNISDFFQFLLKCKKKKKKIDNTLDHMQNLNNQMPKKWLLYDKD